jgi:hypothetical protein
MIFLSSTKLKIFLLQRVHLNESHTYAWFLISYFLVINKSAGVNELRSAYSLVKMFVYR